MSALIQRLSPLDEIDIGKELDRLFALQDRPLGNEKKAMLINEISCSGIPKKAMITGIRDLVSQELTHIKFSTIIASARKYTQFETPKGCDICRGDGYVSMNNKDNYSFSVQCTCDIGTWYSKNHGLTRWNGRRQTYSPRFGLLTLAWPYDTKDIKDMDDKEYAATGAYQETNVNWND